MKWSRVVWSVKSRRVMARVIAAASGLCVGCGSTNPEMIESLDGIVGAKQFFHGGQVGVMSLHSLAVEPGVLIKLPTSDRHMKPSAILEHVDAPTSYLRVETYDARLSVAQMAAIRKEIDRLTTRVGAQFSSRLSEAKARADERKANENLEGAKREKAEAEVRAADLESRKVEVVERAAESLSVVRDNPENVTGLIQIMRDGLMKPRTAPASTIAPISVPNSVPSSTPAESLAAEPVDDARMRATAAVKRTEAAVQDTKDKEKKTDESQDALLTALSTPNVIVFRWNGATKESGGLDLFGRASAEGKSQRQMQGYAVLNGIRRVRLVIGKDFENAEGTGPAKAMATLAGNSFLASHDAAVVTHVLQTKQIMYLAAEDLEETIKAQLELKASDFTGAGLTPAEIAELKIKASYEGLRLRSLQNSGYFDSPRVDMIPITKNWQGLRFGPDKPLHPLRGTGAVGASPTPGDPWILTETVGGDWITLYAVTTTVEEILRQRRLEN